MGAFEIITKPRNVPLERPITPGNTFFYPPNVPLEQKRSTKPYFFIVPEEHLVGRNKGSRLDQRRSSGTLGDCATFCNAPFSD